MSPLGGRWDAQVMALTHAVGMFDVATTETAIAHELDLVRSAIALVAGQGAPRVSVANLRFGEELIAEASRLAAEGGVSLRRVWSPASSTLDLVVEASPAP
jgi:hypothetical protein